VKGEKRTGLPTSLGKRDGKRHVLELYSDSSNIRTTLKEVGSETARFIVQVQNGD
jgi:hypothetical protein